MLQNPCKTVGFKKSMVYKTPPGGGGGGGVNHIQPVAYIDGEDCHRIWLKLKNRHFYTQFEIMSQKRRRPACTSA